MMPAPGLRGGSSPFPRYRDMMRRDSLHGGMEPPFDTREDAPVRTRGGFGALAYVRTDFNPHFLLFVATGLRAGVPVLMRRSTAGLPSSSV